MSPQSENAHPSCSTEPREFSLEERKVLLNLAHHPSDPALEAREISLIPPSPHLAEPRGVFTTLYHRGGLRGCVGYIFPTAAVYRTVAETARAAAFEDSRFWPVTPDETTELEVSLSILSQLKPLLPDACQVGKHRV